MMLKLLWWLAADPAPYHVTANEIGVPTSTGNIGAVIANLIQGAMGVLGAAAMVFIIYGGLQLTYSRGNAKNVERGRETLLYATVGLVTAIAGYAIVFFITRNIK